jgi:hypothetical protein
MVDNAVRLKGYNNKREPRQPFADHIATLDDASFVKDAETIIWLSAYANNNPHSDYHWQADACYDEALRRGKPELYNAAFTRVYNSVR